MLLDPINLVTCLYRLAKMSFSQRSRNLYLTELQRSPTFQLLLRECLRARLRAGARCSSGGVQQAGSAAGGGCRGAAVGQRLVAAVQGWGCRVRRVGC
jgi:hypothetical protein